MLSSIEIAWMAALFEGEGYIAAPKGRTALRKGTSLRLRIKMCDRDVLERFRKYAGRGNIHGPFKPSGFGKRPTYDYVAQGAAAYALVIAFWSWLGERRKAQISAAVTAWSSLKPTSLGRSLTREQAEEIRRRSRSESRGIGRRLAREFNVTPGMISVIKHERAWI